MVFGSAEHFDYIYSKIRDDDYVCDFYYNVLEQRIEISVIPKKYKNVHTGVYLTRAMWDDKFYFNYLVKNFKTNFKKALKRFEEDRHFQITG